MDNFNFKKYLAEGKLLKENAPGYDTRKMGEALPTLESVKAAYEAKNDIKEYDSDIENQTGDDFGFWFRAGVKAEKQIQQAKDLLTQNGIEFNAEGRFGIDFQGKGYEKSRNRQLKMQGKDKESDKEQTRKRQEKTTDTTKEIKERQGTAHRAEKGT